MLKIWDMQVKFRGRENNKNGMSTSKENKLNRSRQKRMNIDIQYNINRDRKYIEENYSKGGERQM